MAVSKDSVLRGVRASPTFVSCVIGIIAVLTMGVIWKGTGDGIAVNDLFFPGEVLEWLIFALSVRNLIDTVCMFSEGSVEFASLPWVSISGWKIKEFSFREWGSINFEGFRLGLSNGSMPCEHKFGVIRFGEVVPGDLRPRGFLGAVGRKLSCNVLSLDIKGRALVSKKVDSVA